MNVTRGGCASSGGGGEGRREGEGERGGDGRGGGDGGGRLRTRREELREVEDGEINRERSCVWRERSVRGIVEQRRFWISVIGWMAAEVGEEGSIVEGVEGVERDGRMWDFQSIRISEVGGVEIRGIDGGVCVCREWMYQRSEVAGEGDIFVCEGAEHLSGCE